MGERERAFEGEAPTALPVEGATRAPVMDEKDWDKGLRVYSDDDDDDERNQFLTLAMGECWHSYELGCPVLTCKGGGFICGLCHDFVVANNDFATEEDFSKLWNWIQTVPEFRRILGAADESSFVDRVSRRAFADKVYDVSKKNQYKREVNDGEHAD